MITRTHALVPSDTFLAERMRAAEYELPPGPRLPSAVQTLGWWARPIPFLERCRARYGRRFTIDLLGQGTFVMLSDPNDVKALFTAPPDLLHPGEGARVLEPVVGRNSVILLDEGSHLEQRKLMLPAFHGERMQRLAGAMAEVAEREAGRWPTDEPVALHPRLQALTLEVILRAVFGVDPGVRHDALSRLLTEILDLGARPAGMLPWLQRDIAGVTPWARFKRLRGEADRLIFELIEERRRDGADDRDDVLAMLLAARHEDGSEMSPQELRDELMTLLVAGHETTASELAWAFSRLVHEPRVLSRLTEEVAAADGEAYLTATIQETLRHHPVLPNAAPRLVMRPVEVGGFHYPPGICLVANAYLVHHDPEIYWDPYAFRPERFLDEQPGTYTWIPFGGGRRRCLGASFAMLEMKTVLRAVLRRWDVLPVGDAERARRRSITLSPRREARVVLERPARAGANGEPSAGRRDAAAVATAA